jgi:hypothetical protein
MTDSEIEELEARMQRANAGIGRESNGRERRLEGMVHRKSPPATVTLPEPNDQVRLIQRFWLAFKNAKGNQVVSRVRAEFKDGIFRLMAFDGNGSKIEIETTGEEIEATIVALETRPNDTPELLRSLIEHASVLLHKDATPSPRKELSFGLLFMCGCLGVVILCFSFNAIHPGMANDEAAFKAALEKIDKGLPVNEREAKALNDFLNKKDRERAKEIERRHGE